MEENGDSADDWVGTIVGRWRTVRPDLDPTPMLVVARIGRLAAVIDELLRPPFAGAGLAHGDFDLLAALRRQGPPHAASPGRLAEAMLVTTGATTKRLDRLERQGYVTRAPSQDDGRGRLVTLTASGLRVVDELFTAHLANEASILGALTPTQQDDLGRLLGVFAAALEGVPDRSGEEVLPVQRG